MVDKETLEKYCKLNMTRVEIGAALGIERSTVGKYMLKYGLSNRRVHLCATCGNTDPSEFYGNQRITCKSCHNIVKRDIQRANKLAGIEYLGGECVRCGYDKYQGALDFHHVDSSIKHDDFVHLKSWGKERREAELDKCILLCANCHREEHAVDS